MTTRLPPQSPYVPTPGMPRPKPVGPQYGQPIRPTVMPVGSGPVPGKAGVGASSPGLQAAVAAQRGRPVNLMPAGNATAQAARQAATQNRFSKVASAMLHRPMGPVSLDTERYSNRPPLGGKRGRGQLY